LAAAACQRSVASGAAAALAVVPDAPPAYVSVRPAIRCAECHGAIHQEWTTSAHARAASEPLYVAMRADSQNAGCDRCHAPLAKLVEPGDPVAGEGVTCELCHAIVETGPDRTGAAFQLALTDNTERGPICDSKDHYFHKMGCAPFFAESRFCGGCHVLFRDDIPIFTDYEEWRAGPYSTELDCQDCHMPKTPGEVAVGWPSRHGVAHHGFLGRDAKLRAKALQGRWSVKRNGDALEVEVLVRNGGAGHYVPAGLPGRQIVVRVVALDADGAELARDERMYQRVLVDDLGREVPFYRAVKVGADVRIAPKALRVEHFKLATPSARKVRLEVVWRDVSPELAAQLHRKVEPDQPLAGGELAPGGTAEWRP